MLTKTSRSLADDYFPRMTNSNHELFDWYFRIEKGQIIFLMERITRYSPTPWSRANLFDVLNLWDSLER